ncbi:NADH:ubiquinone oxidoreductase subunit 4 (chain M) [Microbacterium sp. BR1]|uniref:NADH:ubiquinone oxidoreductase subunit 4 (chain M) n=1 Tax=Microbacterium sp. BR1 TaxID=1070896 RepID=UPI000C2C6A1C|nr:NADH:ubiquinone oxidoreductase subunit 4 (chain M) [Microbacterium sp. BR1]
MHSRRAAVASTLFAAMLLISGCATSSHIQAEDDDLGAVDVYDIGADATLSPAPSGPADEIWTMFVGVVTEPVAADTFNSYRVGDSADSDTMAYVSRDLDDPTEWMLVANAAYADDADTLLQTLIHEYAHVLSLNVAQVPEPSGDCDTLELSEGCALPTSFIYAFQTDFWDAYGDEAPGPDNDDAEVADAFYAAHEEDFVSDYAATNVTEDFAESFAAFVLEAEPDSDSPLAQKLDFFWAVPEFVQIRAHISEQFGLE